MRWANRDNSPGLFAFPGTTLNDQVTVAVLQHIYERKAGRYIYPRLRQDNLGNKLLDSLAGWEPPPILPLRGYEKQFAASNTDARA